MYGIYKSVIFYAGKSQICDFMILVNDWYAHVIAYHMITSTQHTQGYMTPVQLLSQHWALYLLVDLPGCAASSIIRLRLWHVAQLIPLDNF